MIALWVLTRMLMLRIFTLPNSNYITGDVRYYHAWLTMGTDDAHTLFEYPVPVLWGLRLLAWMSGGSISYFTALFAVTMLALDALMALCLWRSGHRAGTLWWILFVLALGPLMWFRFDMVPAVCMGLAALWFRRHPAASGAAIAVGAAVKLWPALLILPMIGRRRAALRRLAAFGVTGGALGIASLVETGWARTVSPLTWQSDRGLQIESVVALVPMIHRAGHPDGSWVVAMSRYNAFEVTGPGVETWLGLSSVLMGLAVALAVGLGVIAWLRNGLDQRTAVLGAVVIAGALIVANKTLSPQYFIWWGAPVAALIDHFSAENSTDGTDDRLVRILGWATAALLLVTGFLTQSVYPLSYSKILSTLPGTSWATWLLVTRNVVAVVTFLVAVAALVASLRLHRRAQPTITAP